METSQRFWAVRQDTGGCRYFLGGTYDFATQEEAQARIDQLRAGQRKEHKLTYEILPYTPGKQREAMEEYKIFG